MLIVFKVFDRVIVTYVIFYWVACLSEEVNCVNGNDFIFNNSHGDTDLLKGKTLYEKYSNQIITYGDCWEKSIKDLHVGCKRLTEEVHSRLAFSFAGCFLEKSGIEVPFCSFSEPLSTCLKKSDDRVFSTYREFFVHTQSICYFLQHKLWQQQTENLIFQLSKNSAKVSKQLDETQKSQASMLEQQHIVFQNQLQLINNSATLSSELEMSRMNAKTVFEEFKSTTQEQRMLIFEIFDRLRKLQSVVLGEFTGVYTFIFYLVSVVIAYLLTSTPRTADARFWILLTVTMNAILERLITIYSIDEETEKKILLDADGPIYHRVWMCRKAGCLVSGAILMWCSYRFRDFNALNNRLLVEIQQQNWEMQKFIRSIKNDSFERSKNDDNCNGKSINVCGVKDIPKPQRDSTSLDFSVDESFSYLSPTPGGLDSSIPCSPNTEIVEHQTETPKSKKPERQRRKSKKLSTPVINTEALEEISELSFSPSGRYNLRRRSKPPAGENADKQSSPLHESVIKAAELSLKNIQRIKNMQ